MNPYDFFYSKYYSCPLDSSEDDISDSEVDGTKPLATGLSSTQLKGLREITGYYRISIRFTETKPCIECGRLTNWVIYYEHMPKVGWRVCTNCMGDHERYYIMQWVREHLKYE